MPAHTAFLIFDVIIHLYKTSCRIDYKGQRSASNTQNDTFTNSNWSTRVLLQHNARIAPINIIHVIRVELNGSLKYLLPLRIKYNYYFRSRVVHSTTEPAHSLTVLGPSTHVAYHSLAFPSSWFMRFSQQYNFDSTITIRIMVAEADEFSRRTGFGLLRIGKRAFE